MPALPPDEKLAKLLEQKKLLESRIAELNARQSADQRKRETRKKIVLGALMLREAERDTKSAEWLRKFVDKRLVSARDRKLFDLEPLPAPANENTQSIDTTTVPFMGEEANAT